jgi:hypothetical protein
MLNLWLTNASHLWPPVLVAAEAEKRILLMRLDPANRAKVIMSLLALVLVGIGLIALAWLGARRLRRIARTRHAASSPHEDAWYQKPLAPPDLSSADDIERE